MDNSDIVLQFCSAEYTYSQVQFCQIHSVKHLAKTQVKLINVKLLMFGIGFKPLQDIFLPSYDFLEQQVAGKIHCLL